MEWFFEKAFPWFFGAVLLLIVAGLIGSIHQYGRLMEQCMADGHAEYECIAYLNQGTVTVYHR